MNGTKVLGLMAAGAFFVAAAPIERASAVSLINPGAASAVQDSRQPTTEVHWHHHHWHHWHRWHHRHYWHRWHRHHHHWW